MLTHRTISAADGYRDHEYRGPPVYASRMNPGPRTEGGEDPEKSSLNGAYLRRDVKRQFSLRGTLQKAWPELGLEIGSFGHF